MSVFEATKTIDPNKNYLDDLVGEGKKFTDNESLARGKAEADEFIVQLQTQIKDQGEDLAARKTIEDALKDLHSQPDTKPPLEAENTTQQFSMDDVKSLVAAELASAKETSLASTNEAKVDSMMTAEFGDRGAEVMVTKSKELGMSIEAFRELGQKSPAGLMALMGKKDIIANHTASSGSINTQAMSVTTTSNDVREAELKDMRKSNPKVYYSPTIQNEIMQRAHSQLQQG